MKHIKTYKIFESVSDDIEKVMELFCELSDDGFKIDVVIPQGNGIPDLSKSNILDSRDFGAHRLVTIGGDHLYVEVSNKSLFNIDNVVDTLSFVESYMKGEMGYEIVCVYVYVGSPIEYKYYKSLEYLPKNKMIERISISFVK